MPTFFVIFEHMSKFKLRIQTDLGFEFWADVPGFEGLYQASTYGRIKSLEKRVKSGENRTILYRERIKQPRKLKEGYLKVQIWKDGISYEKFVHRLIAETFLPVFNTDFKEINHKSEVKSENQVWNLEWCNHKYNITYGTGMKRRKEARRRKKESD